MNEEIAAAVKNIVDDVQNAEKSFFELFAPGRKDYVQNVFKKAIPTDTSNNLKHTLLLEMMEPAFENQGERVHKKLGPRFLYNFVGTIQNQRLIVVTGTSGVGKTKLAYDIARQEKSLIIFCRIFECGDFTSPYKLLISHLEAAKLTSDTMFHNLHERLLLCFLEYVVKILEASEQFQFDDNRICELVIRSQRNGLANRLVRSIFQGYLSDIDSIQQQSNETLMKHLIDRIHKRLSSSVVIGWFHDEANALMEVFPERFVQLHLDSVEIPKGMFYSLLVIIRQWIDSTNWTHVLCGTDMNMSQQTLNKYSPAQGMSAVIKLSTSLSTAALRRHLSEYLTDAAMVGVSDEALSMLTGRPLFISFFWQKLVSSLRDASVTPTSASEYVKIALKEAYTTALTDSKVRLNNWIRDRRIPLNDDFRKEFVFGVYWCLKKSQFEEPFPIGSYQHELREAIAEGIFNATDDEIDLKARSEPVTADALLTIGDHHLISSSYEDDFIGKYICKSRKGAFETDSAKGDLNEELVIWYLLKKSLRFQAQNNGQPIGFKELLEDFLPEENLFYEYLEDYIVPINALVDCSKILEGECFLSQLLVTGGQTRLLHQTPTSAACADVIFLVEKKEDRNEKRLVLMQLKYRNSSSLPGAFCSLDMGKWFPDRNGKETRSHKAFRSLFACSELARQYFSNPFRVVLNSDAFSIKLCYQVTYFNVVCIPSQPIILASSGKLFKALFHVDYPSPTAIGLNYLQFNCTATPIRHWPSGATDHPQKYLFEVRLLGDTELRKASLTVKIWGNEKFDVLKGKLLEIGCVQHEPMSSKHGLLNVFQSAAKVCYYNIFDAIRARVTIEKSKFARASENLNGLAYRGKDMMSIVTYS